MRDNSWRRRFQIRPGPGRTWDVYENGVRREDLSGGIGQEATKLRLRQLYPYCMIGRIAGVDTGEASVGR